MSEDTDDPDDHDELDEPDDLDDHYDHDESYLVIFSGKNLYCYKNYLMIKAKEVKTLCEVV